MAGGAEELQKLVNQAARAVIANMGALGIEAGAAPSIGPAGQSAEKARTPAARPPPGGSLLGPWIQRPIRDKADATTQIASQHQKGDHREEVGGSQGLGRRQDNRKEVQNAEEPTRQRGGSGMLSKRLARRQHQLRTGHCIAGHQLQWTRNRNTAECGWCHYKTQTWEHLLKNCPCRKEQQKILWAEVRRDTTGRGMNGAPIRFWTSCAPRRWGAGWDRERRHRNRARTELRAGTRTEGPRVMNAEVRTGKWAEGRARNWRTRRARGMTRSRLRERKVLFLGS